MGAHSEEAHTHLSAKLNSKVQEVVDLRAARSTQDKALAQARADGAKARARLLIELNDEMQTVAALRIGINTRDEAHAAMLSQACADCEKAHAHVNAELKEMRKADSSRSRICSQDNVHAAMLQEVDSLRAALSSQDEAHAA